VAEDLSHNLNGQRLGRKGRDTRERIIAAAQEILTEPIEDGLITLSEVARRASIRIGTLYLYFADLTELVLAVLEPVMATVEDEYVHLVREYWPDKQLGARARQFVQAYFGFWSKHTRLLHLRNNMADRGDERMLQHRVRSAIPVMRLLVTQMDSRPTEQGTITSSTVTALMTGLERVATVMTDTKTPFAVNEPRDCSNWRSAISGRRARASASYLSSLTTVTDLAGSFSTSPPDPAINRTALGTTAFGAA
jgi:AcrR family transcriptional regulator